jgi:rubrerythrin
VNERDARLLEPEALLDQMGAPLDPAGYDWTAAGAQPLTAEERFQLTYAAQVEWGTEGTFESLNISDDPVVRRFLAIWLEQEVVHAELLARFLAAGGVSVDPLHRTPRQRRASRRGRLVNQVARRLVGDDFFAVHMTWGAVNELTTLRFYGVIRSRTRNELLRTLLRDIMVQEAVHYSFYRNAAIRRLSGNRRGQRITRWTIDHLWSIVGTGLRTREDADRLLLELLGTDERGIAPRIDAQLDRIPGLADLRLLQRTVDRARGTPAEGQPPRFARRRRAVSATFAAASEARLSA